MIGLYVSQMNRLRMHSIRGNWQIGLHSFLTNDTVVSLVLSNERKKTENAWAYGQQDSIYTSTHNAVLKLRATTK